MAVGSSADSLWKAKTKKFSSRLSTALGDEGNVIHESEITASLLKAHPHPRLNLDDVLTVLHIIFYCSNKETVSYEKVELDNIIG